MERVFHKGTWQEGRSFSPAVVTKGGTTVWAVGHGGPKDADGKSLAGDFEAKTSVLTMVKRLLNRSRFFLGTYSLLK